MPEDAQSQEDVGRLYFEFFNEIGILAQLSRALFEARLEDGLTVPHFSVLNHLVRLGDGRAPLAIANAFQVPKTTMTHTLAGLEKRGLIEMKPNPEDGRSKLVYITQAGRNARENNIDKLGEDVGKLVSLFEPGRILDILPELRDLRKVLDENRSL